MWIAVDTLPSWTFFPQKTVLAVLDRLINPHCPFLPEKKGEYDNEEEQQGIEGAWSSLPDDPRKYHFYYHILEADEHGRLPKNGDKVNPRFNSQSWSCLRHIAQSKNKVREAPIPPKWTSYCLSSA